MDMTSQSGGREELRWLLEPPGAGEINIHVEFGEGAELTSELREALERLASAVQESEVSGYACPVRSVMPCAILTSCPGQSLCASDAVCNPLSCRIEPPPPPCPQRNIAIQRRPR
jgi:hypothetical protein